VAQRLWAWRCRRAPRRRRAEGAEQRLEAYFALRVPFFVDPALAALGVHVAQSAAAAAGRFELGKGRLVAADAALAAR
jgi:hypothetical protein